MYRKIIHIDMDSFFASVEQRDYPELRGIPMAVGGTSDRGVLATASYEARKFGVHSAMSSKRAMELCPELVIVPGNHAKYKEVSSQIHEIFHEYTDIIEPISLDEAFLDVTDNKPGIELATDIAKEIKQKIKERLKLTASAGVSYNKFLAKIASDWDKPDGFYLVHPEKAKEFIAKLPIEKFWGVGKVTAKRMHELGIHTGYQLGQWSLGGLTQKFGKAGEIYYNFARGIDERPVVAERIRKSVGCEVTFERDIFKKSAVIIELYHVVEELIRRLDKGDFNGYTLTLKIKFHDFVQITRSHTDSKVFRKMQHILPTAKELLKAAIKREQSEACFNSAEREQARPKVKDVDFDDEHTIRLIGLSVSNPKEEIEKHGVWVEQEIQFED